jgi:hypothetical protein
MYLFFANPKINNFQFDLLDKIVQKFVFRLFVPRCLYQALVLFLIKLQHNVLRFQIPMNDILIVYEH